MKGSVPRCCEPVSQGPLVPGHTDDWVFKLSRLGLPWFQNREKRTPTEKLCWEPLTLEALWHGIMKSAFPHSLSFISFAWWAGRCLLACWAQFITSDETQTRAEFAIYSLKELILRFWFSQYFIQWIPVYPLPRAQVLQFALCCTCFISPLSTFQYIQNSILFFMHFKITCICQYI